MRTRTGTPETPGAARRRAAVRRLAAGVSGVVGLLYLALLVLVAAAESGAPENTFGAYLFLAATYLVGAGLLLTVDQRGLWAVGAAVQVGVLVLFVLFGAGAVGPGRGVLDYAALSGLHMGLWAAGATAAEVVLLALLSYLALTPRRRSPGSPVR